MAKASRNLTRCVYVITSTVGMVKIGIAANLKFRLAGMQTGSPVPLSLFNSVKVSFGLANRIEACCHQELAEFRNHGEWFKVSPEVAWECVQKHAKQVVSGTDRSERRRCEDWLIRELEALEKE